MRKTSQAISICITAIQLITLPLSSFADTAQPDKAQLVKDVVAEPVPNNMDAMSLEQLRELESKLVRKLKVSAPTAAKASVDISKIAPKAEQGSDSQVKQEKANGTESNAPAKIANKTATVAKRSAKAELDETSNKLTAAEARIQTLSQELEEARNRLLIAETEVDRLSRIIESRKNTDLSSSRNNISNRPTVQLSATASTRTIEPKMEDTQIATVVAEKAFLRSGPGKNNSPLMSVTQGTRLAIEIEQNGWYRVISPTGTRAWVDGEVIAFGAKAGEAPTQTVQVKGFGNQLDEAFEAIRKSPK